MHTITAITGEALTELFARGKLRECLMNAFSGQLAPSGITSDFDFIIMFGSAGVAPTKEQLRSAVESFYRGRGYTVQETDSKSDVCYEAIVSHDRSGPDRCCFSVIATTRYPAGLANGDANLRISAERMN